MMPLARRDGRVAGPARHAALLAIPVLLVAAAGGSAQTAPEGDAPAWAMEGVPDNVWVLVEASASMGDDEAKAVLEDAEAVARASVAEREDDADRRFALAVVLGMRTEREGGRTKVRLASALYEELLVVLSLEPDHVGAHHLLGRLHAAVCRMGGLTRWLATNLLGGGVLGDASWEEAERHLSLAELRAPEVPDHHLQLARLYLDTNRPGLAMTEVGHVLSIRATSPLEQAARAEASELREELERSAGR